MPNLSRKDMPQVKTQDLGKALSMVSDKVKVTKETIPASKLKKSQKELYKDKVKGIANRFNSPKAMKPLIISKDNHIVDGHHRWGAAIYKWGEDVKIPVYRINLSANNAIKLYKHIADVIDEVIKEVGEGSAKPFKFKKTQDTPNEKQYMFLTKSELPYYVSFDYFDRWGLWGIEFSTLGGADNEVVNQGEMYNVMATIANVTKDFIKRVNPKGLLYNPAKNFDGDTRRAKLYLAYFKKLLPKWKLTKQSVYTVFNNPTIKEAITIPIEIGDTVLGGKFKNKPIVVKSIDKNEKGDITINGKPLLKYRLKEGVWSSSAITNMNRKSMDAKYFLSDENGNILPGPYKLKTMSSVHKTFKISKIWGGFDGVQNPKIVNVHDLKKDGKVVDQYNWTKQGAYLKDIEPKYIKYKNIEKQLKSESVNEANAVSGGKVHKFITGKNLTFKGKKYPNLYFEVLRIDNKSKLVTLKILSPKELFGKELNVPFKTIRRGPFLKTDTSGLGEDKINEIGDASTKPFKWKANKNITKEMKKLFDDSQKLSPNQSIEVNDGRFDYTFTNDDGMKYVVNILGWMQNNGPQPNFTPKPLPDTVLYESSFNVAFNTLRDSKKGQEINTNLGEHFRIMSTMKDIINDFLVKSEKSGYPVKILTIAPKSDDSNDNKLDSKRGRLYMAFIIKQMKNLKTKNNYSVTKSGDGDFVRIQLGKWSGGNVIQTEDKINEIPMGDLQKIDQFADKKLNPIDIVITDKHFFDQINNPRNGKEISNAELIGFFKRLSKKKKEFVEFLNKYNSLVATDDRTNINIPFMKQANKAIAKTIMRKKDFKTPDKKLDI